MDDMNISIYIHELYLIMLELLEKNDNRHFVELLSRSTVGNKMATDE